MTNPNLLELLISHIKVASSIKKTAQKVLYLQSDISLSELVVLLMALAKPGLAQQDIAQKLNLSHAAISRQMAGLEEKGYLAVRPDPHDKRRTNITVTTAGQAALKKALQSVSLQLQQQLTNLDQHSINQQVAFNSQLVNLLSPAQGSDDCQELDIDLYSVWHKLLSQD